MIEFDLQKTRQNGAGTLLVKVKSQIEPGQAIGLNGPSGSGKTTLLRLLAGLEQTESGHISFEGQVWEGSGVSLPLHKRPLGLLFQDQALFPHMALQRQLEFAQGKDRRAPEWISGLVEALELRGLERRLPGQLSGGQRQRLAFARSLARKPRLLLLDEPFQGLEGELVQKTIQVLQTYRIQENATVFVASHRIQLLQSCCDAVWQMQAGQVTNFALPVHPPMLVLGFHPEGDWWNVNVRREAETFIIKLPQAQFPKLSIGQKIEFGG